MREFAVVIVILILDERKFRFVPHLASEYLRQIYIIELLVVIY
jgi:hypothetical protein